MRIRILGSAAGGGLPQWNCNCPNCQQRLDATAFVAVPALDHVVSALVDASPNLRRRDSIDRRRNRSPVPPTPPPPPSNGFVTAAELMRRSNGAVPPPPTPADTTILGAGRALDPRSDSERAVEGLDGLALAGGRSALERAVDRLNDLPGAAPTSPPRTPPPTSGCGGASRMSPLSTAMSCSCGSNWAPPLRWCNR